MPLKSNNHSVKDYFKDSEKKREYLYCLMKTFHYLSLFSLSFNFTQWSAGTAKSTIRQVLSLSFFLLFLLAMIRSGLLAEIWWSICISKSQRSFAPHILKRILDCAYTIYHHNHVALVARISLTLSRHSSLSFIALGRSSGQHPVSSHSCWMYVRAGRPAFARPCVGVHESTSLMSSSLLLQLCPACLVRLTWIVFVIGGRWPYSWCHVGCCRQDLFKIVRSILV